MVKVYDAVSDKLVYLKSIQGNKATIIVPTYFGDNEQQRFLWHLSIGKTTYLKR